MAFKLFTLVTLCVFLANVFSLPIGEKIVGPVTEQDETSDLSPSVLAPSENDFVKLSVPDESVLGVVKRKKRQIMTNGKCPEGERWFLNECITQEEYDELMSEDKR